MNAGRVRIHEGYGGQFNIHNSCKDWKVTCEYGLQRSHLNEWYGHFICLGKAELGFSLAQTHKVINLLDFGLLGHAYTFTHQGELLWNWIIPMSFSWLFQMVILYYTKFELFGLTSQKSHGSLNFIKYLSWIYRKDYTRGQMRFSGLSCTYLGHQRGVCCIIAFRAWLRDLSSVVHPRAQ